MTNKHTEPIVDLGTPTLPHEALSGLDQPAEYMLASVPAFEQRRAALYDLQSLELNYETERSGLIRALDLLAEQTGWEDSRRQAGQPVDSVSDNDRAAAFASWLADRQPDPAPLVADIRSQQIRNSHRALGYVARHGAGIDRGGADMQSQPAQTEESLPWDSVFQFVYGDRWKAYRNENRFSFATSPLNADPLEVSEAVRDTRKIFTRHLDKQERVAIQQDTAPMLTRREMKERFGVDAELRGIIYLGDSASGGVALGILDTRRNPRDSSGRLTERVFDDRPFWTGDPGLLLVPAKIEVFDEAKRTVVPARVTEDSHANWEEMERNGVPTVQGFSAENPVILGEAQGQVILGRRAESGQLPQNVLHELFPLPHKDDDFNYSISSTVSREHCMLTWWADGTIQIINMKPANDTLVQAAHAPRRVVADAEALATVPASSQSAHTGPMQPVEHGQETAANLDQTQAVPLGELAQSAALAAQGATRAPGPSHHWKTRAIL